jgi:hypothetical protein
MTVSSQGANKDPNKEEKGGATLFNLRNLGMKAMSFECRTEGEQQT